MPAASSADLSADGHTIRVGTALEEIVAIDASALQVTGRYVVAGVLPLPNKVCDRPIEVPALAGGKCMVRLRQPVASEALLGLWDPHSNLLTNLTSAAPLVFQNGVGATARSANHSKFLVAANDSSGELAVFDTNGTTAGPKSSGPEPCRGLPPIPTAAVSPLSSLPVQAPSWSYSTPRSSPSMPT